jgi:2-polyprenyl-3-methyl-5-hydroxy-6-metoxy-1,4-benzoquinol methylase
VVIVAIAAMDHYDYCAQFIVPPERVLDVGSGSGKFLCQMAKRGFTVHGVEVNPEYINDTLARAAAEGITVTVSPGRGENLPFAENHFDFVNCSEVTEHVENPVEVCKEISRVLMSGGRCYISFHNRFGLYDYHYHFYFINWMPRRWAEFILNKFNKQKPDGEAGRQKLITMHYYTFRQAFKLLESVGFEVIDIRRDKIKKHFRTFSFVMLPLYYIFFRTLYFNTFHFLLKK